MARWRLMTSHYLNTVTPAEWEYKATQSGKSVRKRFTVPRYLDINDPSDWTVKVGNGAPVAFGGSDDGAAGLIIVCLDGQGAPGDVAFLGDPTPDMMPLDDEARELSGQYTDVWSYKPDNADVSYSQTIIDKIDELKANTEAVAPKVQIEGLNELVATLIASQKTMMEAITHSNARRA
jgi:hypothetical protein